MAFSLRDWQKGACGELEPQCLISQRMRGTAVRGGHTPPPAVYQTYAARTSPFAASHPPPPTAAALVRMFRTGTEDGGEDDAAGAAGFDGASSLSKWSDDWKVRDSMRGFI